MNRIKFTLLLHITIMHRTILLPNNFQNMFYAYVYVQKCVYERLSQLI